MISYLIFMTVIAKNSDFIFNRELIKVMPQLSRHPSEIV